MLVCTYTIFGLAFTGVGPVNNPTRESLPMDGVALSIGV